MFSVRHWKLEGRVFIFFPLICCWFFLFFIIFKNDCFSPTLKKKSVKTLFYLCLCLWYMEMMRECVKKKLKSYVCVLYCIVQSCRIYCVWEIAKKNHWLCRDIVRLGKQVFHFVYIEPNENLIIISGEKPFKCSVCIS